MSRLSVFDSPLLLGFDHFERVLDRAKASSEGYPPYNIEQLSEEHLRITLAVAGFKIADLEVEIEDNQLVIKGRHKSRTTENPEFFWRFLIFLFFGILLKENTFVK